MQRLSCRKGCVGEPEDAYGKRRRSACEDGQGNAETTGKKEEHARIVDELERRISYIESNYKFNNEYGG